MSIHMNSWDSSRGFFVTNILLDWSQSFKTCESKWRRPELLWNRFCFLSSLHPYTITHRHKTMGARARLTHPHLCVLGLLVITVSIDIRWMVPLWESGQAWSRFWILHGSSYTNGAGCTSVDAIVLQPVDDQDEAERMRINLLISIDSSHLREEMEAKIE